MAVEYTNVEKPFMEKLHLSLWLVFFKEQGKEQIH